MKQSFLNKIGNYTLFYFHFYFYFYLANDEDEKGDEEVRLREALRKDPTKKMMVPPSQKSLVSKRSRHFHLTHFGERDVDWREFFCGRDEREGEREREWE